MKSDADDARQVDLGPKAERHLELQDMLSAATGALDRGETGAMDHFMERLWQLRTESLGSEWRALVKIVTEHPICGRLRDEPLTRRAFLKPRGYAGDACMLDYMYGEGDADGATTLVGERLTEWIRQRPAATSVRERRRMLAELIDETARSRTDARILAVACGHLREAQNSHAVQTNRIDELVALDQDEESLAVVAREHATKRVTPIRASVRRLLMAPRAYGAFDLIYSAGLFDYLQEDIASALVASLFDALAPGGSLLVANFAPELRDIGYMEAVMDWHLIYRNEEEIQSLCSRIEESEIASTNVKRDTAGNVVYMTVQRNGRRP